MDQYNLKIFIAIMGGVAFALIFILLAFIVPLDKKETLILKPKNVLEEVSEHLKKKKE